MKDFPDIADTAQAAGIDAVRHRHDEAWRRHISDDQWDQFVQQFRRSRGADWPSRCGPRPGEDGCLAPGHILEKYGYLNPKKSRTGGASETATSSRAKTPQGVIRSAETSNGSSATSEAPLEKYTHVPGAVGEIIDWITRTARRPNRVLALGAAIVTVGTLIGRRAAGPTRSGTHLYVVPVAPTGAGKQHLFNTITALMYAVKAQDHLGPGEYFSLSGIHSLLQTKPLVLTLQDEIGAFLKNVTSGKASTYEKSISRVLRTLWGLSFAMLPGVKRVRDETDPVHCPALSVFGVSTPGEIHEALQGDSIANGFLNRLLILDAGKRRPAEVEPELNPGAVPPALTEKLQNLYRWSGPDSLEHINNPAVTIAPDVLPWADDTAHNYYRDFTRTVDRQMDDNPDVADYLARCAETAVRLATIRAAGRLGYDTKFDLRDAMVDLSDIEWGAGIAWTASQALIPAIQDFVPETDHSQMAERVLRCVQNYGPLKRRDIQLRFGSKLKAKELTEHLKLWTDTGTIVEEKGVFRAVPQQQGE